MKLKIFTFKFSESANGFDDKPLQGFIADKEVIDFSEHFFIHDKTPYLTILISYRLLNRDERKAAPRQDPRKELDEAKRKEIYAETQEILNMEGGPVIPLFKYQVDAATTKIKTPKLVGGQFGLDYFRAARRWWFES